MSVNLKSTPSLRFSEFSSEWKIGSLGSIVRFINGKAYKQEELLSEGKYPVLRVGNFFSNGNWYYSDLELPADKYCSNGDLLYAWSASFGPKIWTGVKTIYHYHIWKVECPPECSLQYIFYQLSKETEEIKANASNGLGLLHITKQTIESWHISFPSLSEQQKIASFLTAIDVKIELLTKKKTLLEQYKKGIMQQLFSQQIRFKDDEGNEFPEWEEKTLGEIGNTYNGLTGKSGEDFGTGKPYIQYKQIFDQSKIDVSKFDYVSIGENEKQSKVQYGDVFFTVSSEIPNEIGMSSVLLDEIEDLYLNSFCFGFRLNSINDFNPHFAQHFFRSPVFRSDVIPLAQGSTRYNISKVSLMKLKIFIPPTLEQQKIASFLSAIDTKINITSQQINNSKAYKKGLLQQLFV